VAVADHFAWEEEWALPYLPLSLQRRLLSEHQRLREAGYPRDQVLLHAEMEMGWFRRFCPKWIVDKIEADHDYYYATGE
jgi:hypothetical protein